MTDIRKLGSIKRGSIRFQFGFSLVELLIVVAVIAMLSAIALPAYNDHVRKTRRAAGAACAATLAQQAERYYTTNMTYVGFAGNTAVCEPKALEFYAVAPSAATAKTYVIQAAPTAAQSDPTCGTLRIDQTGAKTPAVNCW